MYLFKSQKGGKHLAKRVIFHVDVNSAFLSWEACNQLNIAQNEHRTCTDLRTIPSIVGGNEETRHGIVLAKSVPAKKFGIQTAEPIASARRKCPNLTVVPPNFEWYVECSNKFIEILKRYAPVIEQCSIDEAFCDMTGTQTLYGSLPELAQKLKKIIYEELGFTVNVGISSNKILAKMASDFEKPDKVHTLFPEEIPQKMWPLDIGDLYFVGKAAANKLRNLGINTIGDLAHYDKEMLIYHLKKHGETIWNYANGIDDTPVSDEIEDNKGYSNIITLGHDVTDSSVAKNILLSLCETVGTRIRKDNSYISVISVSLTDSEFNKTSKQISLDSSINSTNDIYLNAISLFDSLWHKEPLRQIGIHTSHASKESFIQYDLFNTTNYEKNTKLDSAIDQIRNKYGENSIQRACFLNKK